MAGRLILPTTVCGYGLFESRRTLSRCIRALLSVHDVRGKLGTLSSLILVLDFRGYGTDGSAKRPATDSGSTSKPESKETTRRPTMSVDSGPMTVFSDRSGGKKFKSPAAVSNLIKSLEEDREDATGRDVNFSNIIMSMISDTKPFKKGGFQGTKYVPGSLFNSPRSTLFDWVDEIDTPVEVQFKSIHEQKWQKELEALIPKSLPRNAFEEMMLYQDKIWKFPVDNEAGKNEEENVGFEEHVFLDYLLDEFPENGPIRRFMELVIIGLQQNPYLTVDEKKNQILWFKDYFEQFSEEDLQV